MLAFLHRHAAHHGLDEHHEGHISLKELRVYFALAETIAKSRPQGGAGGEAAPKFSARELRQLVGGEWGKRNAVKKLLAVGLGCTAS